MFGPWLHKMEAIRPGGASNRSVQQEDYGALTFVLEDTLLSPFGSRAALSLVAERPDQASVIHC